MAKQPAKTSSRGKREIIMEAALELFFNKGYSNTKIIEIAGVANIGKGTFYEYFKSKEALLVELLTCKFDADRRHLDEISSSSLSSADKIREFLYFEVTSLEKYGPHSNVLAQEMMSPGFESCAEIRTTLHDMFMHKYAFLDQVISEGISKGEFKKIDTTLATTSVMGAISFYTAFKYNVFQHKTTTGMPFSNTSWNNEELFQLIFKGLE